MPGRKGEPVRLAYQSNELLDSGGPGPSDCPFDQLDQEMRTGQAQQRKL